MKLCILCGLLPAIENSHVVSKLVVKVLKQGTPHGTLRHSNDLGRAAQDGWKGEYLCLECEGKFSKWEGWFGSKVFSPYLKGKRTSFPMSEQLALFAASVHFRHIHHTLEMNGTTEVPPALADLSELLRRVCLDGVVPADGLHLYLEFEPLTTDPALGFPPGINAYLSDSIDGRLFRWHPPGGRVEYVSFVKFPSMMLFCSICNLDGSAPGIHAAAEIKTSGSLDSCAQGRHLLAMMREETLERIHGIQASYERLPVKQYTKNVAKIQAAKNLAQYRAHQAYLADQQLHANWMALRAAAAGSQAATTGPDPLPEGSRPG